MVTATKKKNSQEKLPRDKYFGLIEHAADGIAIVQDGVFKLVNTALSGICGYDTEELLDMPFTKLLTPESQQLTLERYQARMAGKKVPAVYEVKAVTKSGEIRDIEINAALTEYEGKAADEVIIRDITERKQAEEEIARLAKFPNENPNPVMRVAQDGIVLYANKAALPLINKWKCQVGQQLPKYWRKLISGVLRSGSRKDVEINVGKQIISVTLSPVADKGYVNLYGLDITERKRSEAALRESEEEKNTIIEEAPVGICHTDLKGTIKYVNKRFEEESGYSREEIVGKNALKLDWFPEDTLRHFMQRMAARLGGKPHRYWETQFKRKDGTWIWVTTEGKAIKKLGVPVGFQILANNITERKQAAEALQESEEKYKTLVEDAPIGIYFNDFGGTFLYGNKKAEEITGFKREELLGQSFLKLKLLDPKELAKALKLLALNKLGKATGPDRFVLNRKDGTKSIAEIRTRITTVGGKKLVLGMVEDITERKKAKDALQAEKNKLQSVIDAMADGLSIQDKDFNIIYQNEPSLIGAGRDCQGEKCYQAYEARDKVCERCPVEKAFKDGRSHTAERTHLTPSGEVTFWENTASPIKDAQGNIVSCLEITRDITERKKAEQALADEATRRRILVDQSRDGIVVLDQDGKVYETNKQFAEMLGYTPEETAQLNVWDWEYLYPPERVLEMIRTVDEAGDHFETQHRRKDGSVYDVEISTNGAVVAGQKLIFCVCRDITERKKAERTLEESQKFSNSLLESSPNPILVINPDTSVRYVNPAFEKLTGFTPAETAGRKAPYPWWPERKREEITAAFKDAIAHGGRKTERNFQKKNGERFWAAVNSAPVVQEGKPIYFLLNWVDITERKRVEERLRLAESGVKASVSAIGITDLNGNLIYVNPAHADIFGYDSPEEMLGKNIISLFKEADEIKAGIETSRATGGATLVEAVMKRKDGTEFTAEIRASTIMDAQGQPMGLTASIVDITERKRAEEALKESEERYRAVIEGAHDMIQSVALDGSINFVNQAWLDTLGYTKADLPKLNLFEVIHSDSLPHCQEMFNKVITGETAHNVQATFLTKDGREILVEGNATPRLIGDKVVATQGIFRDITERKQMEQQLQEKNEQLDAQNEELRAINEELRATEEELQHSQERLERMFESATDGIIVTTLDGTVLKVNERAAQIIGYASDDELLGKSCFDCVAPSDHQKMANNMQRVIKEGLIKRQEYTLRKADGTEFPAELSTNVIKDASGKAIGLITIARDITERKQMERLFKTVTNSSPVGICIIQDGNFQMVNPQFQKLTGYSEEELLGRDSLDLILADDRDTVRKNAIKMLKGELSSPYQFRVVDKNGEYRWVMETVSSIPYRGRRAILGNYMDITERRQTEERERQLEQELNLAGRLASIGQLAAGVAHEINNPLTGVIGFSHLMLSRDIPEDIKQDLQVIHSEAQRVAKIVENLLVFAHQRKTGREYVNINDIINRVLELRTYEMKVNNIEVEARLASELPLTIADAGQLQQVFLNIVLNAEHFMAKAHNRGRLVVKTEEVNGNIRASFTDDGTGISLENLDKIFNPFFTTKEVGKGTGLGLSICHSIITQHQGRIYAQSQLGKGATFVIELPIVAEPVQTGKAKETGKEPEKSPGAKILVVDDEKAILTFLSRLLTGWGHTVETINNADTALERLKTERYSLILLDIKLPGMSGIELYHHIEKTVPALTRRVMFITGDVMEGTTREFLEKSRAAHITKPLDIEALKKMINHALNQTQAAPVA
jgi:PAS domain S-box-containing protein